MGDTFAHELYAKVGSEPALARPAYKDVKFAGEPQFSPLVPLDALMSVIQFLLILVSYGGLLLLLNGWIAAMLVLSILPKLVQQLAVGWKAVALDVAHKPDAARLWYYDMVLTQAAFVKLLQAFGPTPFFLHKHRALQNKLRKEKNSLAQLDLRWQGVTDLLPGAVMGGAFALITTRLLSGEGSVGNVAITVGAFPAIHGAMTRVVQDCA